MQDLRSAQLPGSSSGNNNLTLNTLSRECSAQLLGTGKSLAWDEFQNPDDLNSEENSPAKAATAAGVNGRLLDNSLFQTTTTSTAAAASLRDLLEKTNLNWENNYFCSPIGMGEREKEKKIIRGGLRLSPRYVLLLLVLRIRKDLFRIRIQLRIFQVPDPTHFWKL